MKTKLSIIFFVCFLLINNTLAAQDYNKTVAGGEYTFNENSTPCLTPEQRIAIKTEIKNSIENLRTQRKLAFSKIKKVEHPLFIWPIRKATGVAYNDVWTKRFHVDLNTEYPNKSQDYNCGTKTYDTAEGYNHMGTDIVTWPFGWKMLDINGVEIIAAAPGQIIAKQAAQFDRSCSNNNNLWNAVYIQHADGSVALYGHMKKNSLTTKNVGDMVEEGEFLGIVGSSGNSAVPHLHFEVYASVDPDVLIDPFAGPCNQLNADSWWKNQKPYNNPNINALLTHSADPIFPTCPDPETTNESDNFNSDDTIYFAVYLRDQIPGTKINLKIIRPDGTYLGNWFYDLAGNYDASWYRWFYSGYFQMQGQWKWEATYQGQTVTHNFQVGTLSVKEDALNAISVYPNPANDRISISSTQIISKVTVLDIFGKTINIIENVPEGIKEMNIESLSEGIYFLTLENNYEQKKTIKIIKE